MLRPGVIGHANPPIQMSLVRGLWVGVTSLVNATLCQLVFTTSDSLVPDLQPRIVAQVWKQYTGLGRTPTLRS